MSRGQIVRSGVTLRVLREKSGRAIQSLHTPLVGFHLHRNLLGGQLDRAGGSTVDGSFLCNPRWQHSASPPEFLVCLRYTRDCPLAVYPVRHEGY